MAHQMKLVVHLRPRAFGPRWAKIYKIFDMFHLSEDFFSEKKSECNPAMANPNRLEGHIFEKSPFWGPKFGLFLKF